MKYVFRFLSIVALAIVFTACPYQSDVPVSEEGLKVPKELLGKWMKTGDINSDNPTFYLITKDKDNSFKIEKNEYSSSDEKYNQTLYSGHLSDVNGTQFMNVLEDGSTSYYIYKIEWKGADEFVMHEMTDNVTTKFTTSSELKGFIGQHMHLEFFFNKDPERYIKR